MTLAADLDLDSLLEKATRALQERQAAVISLQIENEKKPLETVKLDPGIQRRDIVYLDNNDKRRGPVRLNLEKAVVIETEVEKDSAGKPKDPVALCRQKVQNGPEKLVVQAAPETLPPALDWDAKKKKAMTRETSGPKWFDMPAPELTDEIKRDLHILKSRSVLDPKRHYKKGTLNNPPKFFQMGTIIQGPIEFYSSRMTRKERRDNIVEELMADTDSRAYFKRKFLGIQEEKDQFTKKGWKRRKERK